MSEIQVRRTSVGAWISYDIANTVFWTGVVGLAFPLWITKDMGGNDATLGYTLAAVMSVVLIFAPFLGALSDQARRRVPFLAATALLTIGATILLGNGSLLVSLTLFAVALCSMELGTILYNVLLTEVSTEANRGLIGGMGIGIGYLGAFIAVGVALAFSEPRGYEFVFRIVAVVFLVFSLPTFILLRERPRQVSSSTKLAQVVHAFSQLRGNVRSLHRFPGLRTFLIGRFLYTLGVSTTTAFAVLYASETMGLSDRKIQLILLAGISVAIPSGVLWGSLVDRIGPRPVLKFMLLLWMGLLLCTVAIAWLSWPTYLWWVVGSLTGVAMAGIYTADRPYMITFAPPQYIGEFFGLHGMVGKLGRVLGPIMWGLISVTLGLGQPAAVLGLVGCLALSYVMLTRLATPTKSRWGSLVG